MSDKVEGMNLGKVPREYCENTDCQSIRTERDSLVLSVRELTHAQLIGRDLELGLRAELMQTQIDLKDARESGSHDLTMTRRSVTWRVGRIILKPAYFAKRVLKRITR